MLRHLCHKKNIIGTRLRDAETGAVGTLPVLRGGFDQARQRKLGKTSCSSRAPINRPKNPASFSVSKLAFKATIRFSRSLPYATAAPLLDNVHMFNIFSGWKDKFL